jgi:hypothetical protein
LEAFFLEIEDRTQKYADVAYIHDHYTLIRWIVIDCLRENHDQQTNADPLTSAGQIKRGEGSDEPDSSTARFNVPGDGFVSHFIEDTVREMTIQYQFLAEYVEMCRTYHMEDNETEEFAVDETAPDRESVRRATTNIEGEVPRLFERIVESVNISLSPGKRQRFLGGIRVT